MKKNFLIFGDSIVWGAWDFDNLGWVERLRREISKKDTYAYNLGISGDNSEYLLERFDNEIESRWDKNDGELIIIISIGINDSQFVISQKKTRTEIGEFKKNMWKLFEKAKKLTDRLVFVGLTNINEKITLKLDGDKIYKSEYVKKYNSIIEELCKAENILFIPLFDLLKESDLEDGLHPNSKGHEKIFQKIKNFLVKEKII